MKFYNKYTVLFIVFYLLQIIWFNHLLFFNRFSPLVFIYPFLLLPIGKNEILNMLLAFIYGLLLDVASNTGGIFSATSVLIVYLRKVFIILITNKTPSDLNFFRIEQLSIIQKLVYFFVLIFLTHLFLYSFEAFNFKLVGYKITLILINTFVTFFIFILIDLLFFSSRKK